MTTWSQGETTGEMALIEDLPRSASVEALEETRTLELHRDDLAAVLQRSPEAALSMLRDLSARLRLATAGAEELALLTVVERIARRLGQLAEWAGPSALTPPQQPSASADAVRSNPLPSPEFGRGEGVHTATGSLYRRSSGEG